MGKSTQQRLQSIAEHLTREMTESMGFTENPFTCSCQPKQETARIWQITLLANFLLGMGFEITAGEDISDAVLRVEMRQAIEAEFTRVGLGDDRG